MAFPTTLTNWAVRAAQALVGVAPEQKHSELHQVLEVKVGVDNSLVATSLDYRMRAAEGVVINVKGPPYLAKGDGITDDTAAGQAALNAAEAAGGGIVRFTRGTYIGNWILPPKVVLVGDGIGSTILKAKAGSNEDVIKGKDFATLTNKAYAAGDSARGAYLIEIRELTIDGNKANNTAGWGIRVWGSRHRWRNVQVQNCKSGGIWTEFTTHDGTTSTDDVLEAYFTDIKTLLNDGDGWRYRGPHDSNIVNFLAMGNAGWGFRSELLGGSYNGNLGKCSNWNAWANTLGAYQFGGVVFLGGVEAGGPSGPGIEFTGAAGASKITNAMVSAHTIGLWMRGADNHFHGQIMDCSVAGIRLDGAGSSIIHATGDGNAVAVDVVSEIRGNHIFGVFGISPAEVLTAGAAFNSQSTVLLSGVDNGGGRSDIVQFPTATLKAMGWSPVLPASDGTLVVPNLAQTFTALQTFSGGAKIDIVATGSLPAAGAGQDGRVLIEDAGAGDRNLVIYAGGQRFRIDGGVAF